MLQRRRREHDENNVFAGSVEKLLGNLIVNVRPPKAHATDQSISRSKPLLSSKIGLVQKNCAMKTVTTASFACAYINNDRKLHMEGASATF